MTKHIGSHIKAVLFDHDDTLVGTIEAKWAAHKYIAKTYYGKDVSDDELREHWGKPLSVLVRLLYGTKNSETALEYEAISLTQFPKKIHDDTIKTLEHLHVAGLKLGVITATSRRSLNHDMETMGISTSLFDYTQTEEATSFHKPDSRVFKPAIAWLSSQNIQPLEVVYVGDGLHDMKAALGAGFEFIGVTTGLVTQKEFNANGARSISRLAELTRLS